MSEEQKKDEKVYDPRATLASAIVQATVMGGGSGVVSAPAVVHKRLVEGACSLADALNSEFEKRGWVK